MRRNPSAPAGEQQEDGQGNLYLLLRWGRVPRYDAALQLTQARSKDSVAGAFLRIRRFDDPPRHDSMQLLDLSVHQWSQLTGKRVSHPIQRSRPLPGCTC